MITSTNLDYYTPDESWVANFLLLPLLQPPQLPLLLQPSQPPLLLQPSQLPLLLQPSQPPLLPLTPLASPPEQVDTSSATCVQVQNPPNDTMISLHDAQRLDTESMTNVFEICRDISDDECDALAFPTSPESPMDSFLHCILVDWDDTLLPTSFLTEPLRKPNSSDQRINVEDTPACFLQQHQSRLMQLENRIVMFLTHLQRLGDVFIVTNSEEGWVQLSCQKFIPAVWPFLQSIPIVSARTLYESKMPDHPVVWKCLAFNDCIRTYHQCLLSFGDSPVDYEAASHVGYAKNIPFHHIKFKVKPSLEMVATQLESAICMLDELNSKCTSTVWEPKEDSVLKFVPVVE